MPTGVEIANAYVALTVKMPGASREIAAELGRAAPATESAGRNIGSSILSGIGGVLKAGVVGVGAVAGAALGTALFKGFQRLDAIDTARAKLTGLGNDAETVKGVMANALAAVKGTAFGLGDASTVAAQLVAAQIKPGQQLEGVLKSVANSAAAAGTGIGEMGSIYAKVASVGKAQNDSLQQVAQRGIPIYQALASRLGVTTDEIFSMASAGEIGFDQFQQAMTTAAGTVASEMGNTVKGSWANFIASLGRIGAGLMSGLFPKVAPGIQALTKALGPLEDIAARAGAALGEWLGPWIDKMTAWVAAIDFTKVEDGVRGIYDLVVKGDFTGQFRNAFNLEEDSTAVDVILRIRDGIVGIYDYVVKGDFSGAFARAFNVSEDDGIVLFLWGLRDAVVSFFSSLTSGDFSGAASSIGASLQTLTPALSEFGAQLPKVGQAAAKVTAGGVDVLTQVLSFLADNVDTIIQFMPLIVAGFIAWRVGSAAVANATLALRGAELAATPVYFANNILRNNSVRIERELALAKAAAAGSTNVAAAATTRSTVATLAASTASRVAAAGQWLLNAALSANPIGIIIVAITALVGALVWFFTQTELGQQIWSTVMGAIGAAATWLWENVLSPVFTAIGAVFSWLWDNVISPIGTLVINYFRFWGAVAVWLWENVLSPVFGKIGEIFSWVWRTIIQPIVDYIVLAIQGWGIVFGWLYDTIIRPVFAGIMSVLGAGWSWLRDNVFSPLGLAVDAIGKAFGATADAVGKAWEGIKQAAAVPINFVLDAIWNKGLRSFWNDLVTTLKIEDMRLPEAPLIKFASGGVLPGYTPGRDVHQFWSPTGGGLALSGGEAIMRPEFTRLVGGKAGVDALNAAAIAGRLPMGDGVGQIAGDVWDTISRAASVAWEFLTNPGQAIQKHVVDGIITPLASGQNLFGQTIAGLAGNTVKALSGIFPTAAAPGGAGMGWEAMWRIVQSAVPGVSLTSALRPGAVTANGGQSYHALGRAIDLIPATMDTFNRVAALFPNAAELIFSPAGGRQLLNGKPFDGWSDAVRAQHWNHVHLAMAGGGVIPKLYDNGGWLPHGGIAMNLSGRPEPVFTDEQWGLMRSGGSPSTLVVVDQDGALIGRMKVEARGEVRAAAFEDDRAWLGGRKSE